MYAKKLITAITTIARSSFGVERIGGTVSTAYRIGIQRRAEEEAEADRGDCPQQRHIKH